MAMYRPEQLKGHTERALANGVTKDEIGKINITTPPRSTPGWPSAMSAAKVVKQVSRGGQGMKVGFASGLNDGREHGVQSPGAGRRTRSTSTTCSRRARAASVGRRDLEGHPREVAEGVEVVFTSLPGPKEVEQVALGAGRAHPRHEDGPACFDLTTNSPALCGGSTPRSSEKGSTCSTRR